jgi:hypothetical protein
MTLKRTLCLLALTVCALATPELAFASRADFVTAYNYTVRYLPRIQTWAGQLSAIKKDHVNKLIGPESPMNPDYKAVVAINVDTLYTSATVNLTTEPQILTLPRYDYSYSILQVDVFGNVLSTGLTSNSTGGTYALVGPDYTGTLPDAVTRINVPQNWTQLAIRTSLYTLNGTSYIDTQSNAAVFRASTRLQSLSEWMVSPNSGGETQILPIQGNFSVPTKTVVDALAQKDPKAFLDLLKPGMESPSTTPLSEDDKILIENFRIRFDAATLAARSGSNESLSDLYAGVRAAHDAVVANWHFNTVGNNWIHFNNMGAWGAAYLDRASGNLYIQYCNNLAAAYYAQSFLDERSETLTGAGNNIYSIRFTADQIPETGRFWSITAYTGDAIELVPNAADKYAVASYTPGLVTNSDGSITITLKTIGSNETSVPANVLPIPAGRFSVMLRVYAPIGATSNGTYVPPAVTLDNRKTDIPQTSSTPAEPSLNFSSKIQSALAEGSANKRSLGDVAAILGVSKSNLSQVIKTGGSGIKSSDGKVNLVKLRKLISKNSIVVALLTGDRKLSGATKKSAAKKK